MAKRDDIPKTDPSEIEALIQRLKQEWMLAILEAATRLGRSEDSARLWVRKWEQRGFENFPGKKKARTNRPRSELPLAVGHRVGAD
jgi:transposase-like protein